MITDKQAMTIGAFGLFGFMLVVISLVAGLLIDPVSEWLKITDPTNFQELRNVISMLVGVGLGSFLIGILVLSCNDDNKKKAEKEELEKKLANLENEVAELKGANDDR